MNTSPSTRERRRPPRTTLPHDPFEALSLVPGRVDLGEAAPGEAAPCMFHLQ